MGNFDPSRANGASIVRVERDGQTVVISPAGELDISNASKLEEEIRRAIGDETSELVLDLGSLSFIDVAGLRALLLAAKLSSMHGTRLSMVRATAPVQRATEVAGMNGSLPLTG